MFANEAYTWRVFGMREANVSQLHLYILQWTGDFAISSESNGERRR